MVERSSLPEEYKAKAKPKKKVPPVAKKAAPELVAKTNAKPPMEGEIAFSDPDRLFRHAPAWPYNPSVLVTRRGMQVLDQMRKDDQIKAALFFKKMAALSTGWEVISPVDNDPEWEPARYLDYVFANVEGSFTDALIGILSALDYGYSVSEILYNKLTKGDHAGKIGLQAIKLKKPHRFDFDVTEYGELKPDGVLQMTPDGNKRLPKDKFVIMVNQFEFGNWYGTSDLESAFDPWWAKNNAYRWLSMLLERFGIPPIFAMYDPNSLSPAQISQLRQVIERIQAATAGVLPRARADALEFWSPQLAGQANQVFIPALDMYNRDISRALLMPGLLGFTADAQEGSFSRAQVHFDAFMLIISYLRQSLEELITDRLVKPLVDLNYGEQDEYPQFKFKPMSDEINGQILTLWGQLVGGGVVRPQAVDEEHIRAALKFPDIDVKARAKEDQAAQEAADAQAAAAQAAAAAAKAPPANQADQPTPVKGKVPEKGTAKADKPEEAKPKVKKAVQVYRGMTKELAAALQVGDEFTSPDALPISATLASLPLDEQTVAVEIEVESDLWGDEDEVLPASLHYEVTGVTPALVTMRASGWANV